MRLWARQLWASDTGPEGRGGRGLIRRLSLLLSLSLYLIYRLSPLPRHVSLLLTCGSTDRIQMKVRCIILNLRILMPQFFIGLKKEWKYV